MVTRPSPADRCPTLPTWCWVQPADTFPTCNARRFAGPVGGGCSATDCWQAPNEQNIRTRLAAGGDGERCDVSRCHWLSGLCAFRPGYFTNYSRDPISENQICHPRGREAERKHRWHAAMSRGYERGIYTPFLRTCETTALYLLENGLGFLVYAEGMCACGEGSHRAVVAVCR